MSLAEIIDIVSGSAGALAVLLILFFLFVNGKIVSGKMMDELKDSNDDLHKSMDSQVTSLEKMQVTLDASREDSKTVLAILNRARRVTGVTGDDNTV